MMASQGDIQHLFLANPEALVSDALSARVDPDSIEAADQTFRDMVDKDLDLPDYGLRGDSNNTWDTAARSKLQDRRDYYYQLIPVLDSQKVLYILGKLPKQYLKKLADEQIDLIVSNSDILDYFLQEFEGDKEDKKSIIMGMINRVDDNDTLMRIFFASLESFSLGEVLSIFSDKELDADKILECLMSPLVKPVDIIRSLEVLKAQFKLDGEALLDATIERAKSLDDVEKESWDDRERKKEQRPEFWKEFGQRWKSFGVDSRDSKTQELVALKLIEAKRFEKLFAYVKERKIFASESEFSDFLMSHKFYIEEKRLLTSRVGSQADKLRILVASVDDLALGWSIEQVDQLRNPQYPKTRRISARRRRGIEAESKDELSAQDQLLKTVYDEVIPHLNSRYLNDYLTYAIGENGPNVFAGNIYAIFESIRRAMSSKINYRSSSLGSEETGVGYSGILYREISPEDVRSISDEDPEHTTGVIADILAPIRDEQSPISGEVLLLVVDAIQNLNNSNGGDALSHRRIVCLAVNALRIANNFNPDNGSSDYAKARVRCLELLKEVEPSIGGILEKHTVVVEARELSDEQISEIANANLSRINSERPRWNAGENPPTELIVRVQPDALLGIIQDGIVRELREGIVKPHSSSPNADEYRHKAARPEYDNHRKTVEQIFADENERVVYGYFDTTPNSTLDHNSLRAYGEIEIVLKGTRSGNWRVIPFFGDSLDSGIGSSSRVADVEERAKRMVMPIDRVGEAMSLLDKSATRRGGMLDGPPVLTEQYIEAMIIGDVALRDISEIRIPRAVLRDDEFLREVMHNLSAEYHITIVET